MLTAQQVNEIVNYTAEDLTKLIQQSHTSDKFLTAKLLGLNNVSQFVFSATWYNEETDSEDTVKVFVGRRNGLLTAAY